MKKVLVIGYVWPEPNSSAAGTHMMSLLRAFRAENWQVEFASPAQKTEHMVDLSEDGITTQVIALNCSSFDEYVQAYNPDIVMFDRFMMENSSVGESINTALTHLKFLIPKIYSA